MTLFGIAHTLILLAIAATAATLVHTSRRSGAAARVIRLSLGAFLAINELVWYGFRYTQEGFRFPEGLPLELCDVVVWITVFACLRKSLVATEFIYFAGLGGSGMALLTPDLWAPLASYPSIYFFLAHGAVVIAAIALVFGGGIRMRARSLWRVFGLLNLYAAVVGTFNLVYHTNYFYLCEKPANPSILDFFGPWPIYVAAGELFTLVVFGLMWLPARRRSSPQPGPRPVRLEM
jgi:hypothetical integral membrane protein (TIGR02206 family)